MISGSVDGQSYAPVRLVNHSANGYWEVNPSLRCAREWGFVRKLRARIPIGLAVMIGGTALLQNAVPFLLALAYWGYEYIHTRRVTKLLDQRFNEVARAALAGQAPPA